MIDKILSCIIILFNLIMAIGFISEGQYICLMIACFVFSIFQYDLIAMRLIKNGDTGIRRVGDLLRMSKYIYLIASYFLIAIILGFQN